jgi:hypothetical protein
VGRHRVGGGAGSGGMVVDGDDASGVEFRWGGRKRGLNAEATMEKWARGG